MGRLIKAKDRTRGDEILFSRSKPYFLIIEQAKEKAKSIIETAIKEGENIKERVYREAEEKAKLEASKLLLQLNRYKEEVIKESKEEIIELGIKVAKKIIEESIKLNPQLIQNIYREVLSQVKHATTIILKVNPKDIESIELNAPQFLSLIEKSYNVVFQRDESIERGGCILESSLGSIDARISIRLEKLKKLLLEEELGVEEQTSGN